MEMSPETALKSLKSANNVYKANRTMNNASTKLYIPGVNNKQ